MGSTIDVSAVTGNLLRRTGGWTMLEDELPLSLHKYITFDIETRETKKFIWVNGPLNKERLKEELRNRARDGNCTPKTLTKLLQDAYRDTTPKVRTENGKIPYWWTEDIANIRKETMRRRRIWTRIKARDNRNEGENEQQADEEYHDYKKQLRRAINESKKKCWKELLTEIEEDTFGQGYKIVTRTLKLPHPRLTNLRGEAQRGKKAIPGSTGGNMGEENSGRRRTLHARGNHESGREARK